jgi:hypothetical protein
MNAGKQRSGNSRRSQKKESPKSWAAPKREGDPASTATEQSASPREVSPGRVSTADGQFANVLIGVNFRIDPEQIHAVGNSAAADLAAIKQRIGLVATPLSTARTDLSKVLQVNPDSLPIVWTQMQPDEIFVGVLVPDGNQPQTLFDIHSAAIQKMAADWQHVLKNLDSGQQESRPKQDKRRAKRPEVERVGPSAQKLDQALRRGTKAFGVEVALVTNGARSSEPIVTIRAPTDANPAPARLGRSERSVVEIESVSQKGTCELRQLSSKRLHRGEFPTTGPLLRQLGHLAGGPPVQIMLRRYLTEGTERRLAVDFRIEEVVALSAMWTEGSPSPLAFVQQSLDQLGKLPRLDESIDTQLQPLQVDDTTRDGGDRKKTRHDLR